MPNKIKIPRGHRYGPSVKDFNQHFGGADGKVNKKIIDYLDGILTLFYSDAYKEALADPAVEQMTKFKEQLAQESADKEAARNTQLQIAKLQAKTENTKIASEAHAKKQELWEMKRFHNNVAPPWYVKALEWFVNKVLMPLWLNAAPYLTLLFIVVLATMLMKGGGKKGKNSGGKFRNPISELKKNVKGITRSTKNNTTALYKWFIRTWNRIIAAFAIAFHPLYKVSQFFGLFTGGSNKNAIGRTQIESGRCDNLTWVETTPEGSKGSCDNAIHPIDLTWKIDNTKTPEYFDLPTTRKSQLDKYSTIKVPWDVNPEATFYVPQCEKTYYPQTCTKNGICVKADMFEDLGLSCRIKDDKLPTQYPDAKDQPVTSFDDIGVQKCIDIHTLNDVPCS